MRLDAPFQAVQIGQHQFGLDRFGVADRIDAAFDMGDVVVLEAAQHMRDGVDFADIGEELVAEAFAFGGAAHQARDVDEGDARGNDLGGFGDRRQLVEPRIRHGHVADIGLDGAEGIVRRLRRRGLRQRVEQRRLADIGQSDDAAFETHHASFFGFRLLLRRMKHQRHLVHEARIVVACASQGVASAIASSIGTSQSSSALEKFRSTWPCTRRFVAGMADADAHAAIVRGRAPR